MKQNADFLSVALEHCFMLKDFQEERIFSINVFSLVRAFKQWQLCICFLCFFFYLNFIIFVFVLHECQLLHVNCKLPLTLSTSTWFWYSFSVTTFLFIFLIFFFYLFIWIGRKSRTVKSFGTSYFEGGYCRIIYKKMSSIRLWKYFQLFSSVFAIITQLNENKLMLYFK